DSSDLTYSGSSHRGYKTVPDTNSAGSYDDPYALTDLLPFAASAMQAAGGYIGATPSITWQQTMVKPKEGMQQLYEEGFHAALGDPVQLYCEVTEIRQGEDGGRVGYRDKDIGETEEIEGDYAPRNLPPSVLIKIPSDFSSEF